jgi:hypothetical protein
LYLILTGPDRERLGAPERLHVDLSSISNREAIQIRTMGFRTPRMLRLALSSVGIDAEGNEVRDADAKLASDGGRVVDFEVDYAAWTVLMWLALKRAGIDTDVRTLEFDVEGMGTAPDDTEVEPEPGPKDEPPTDPEVSQT